MMLGNLTSIWNEVCGALKDSVMSSDIQKDLRVQPLLLYIERGPGSLPLVVF